MATDNTPPDTTPVSTLQNDRPPQVYGGENEAYYRLLFDQYAVYMATTDATSRLRLQANAFFLTLHTALLAGIAVVLSDKPSPFLYGAAFLGLFAGSALSVVWARLLRSYRAVNTAKFDVIGDLEDLLPTSPLCRAEWSRLNVPSSGYTSLSRLEGWIPWITVATYLLVLLYAFAYALFPAVRAALGAPA